MKANKCYISPLTPSTLQIKFILEWQPLSIYLYFQAILIVSMELFSSQNIQSETFPNWDLSFIPFLTKKHPPKF